MFALLLLFIIMLMRVVQSVYNKKACQILPDGPKNYVFYIMIMNYLSAGFAVLLLVGGRNFSGFNAQAVLIAACSGVFLALNSLCGIIALQGGTIVLNSVFSTAGLIVPCVLGIFTFNEPMSYVQIGCIAILLVAAVLLIDSSKKIYNGFSVKTLVGLIGSMVTNGMVMFCQKLFGESQPEGNVSLFSMLTFLIPAIVLNIVYIFMPRDHKDAPAFPKKLVLYAAYLAFAVFIIQQFVTLLTPMLSSAVLFVLVNGGATVISAVVGMALYKEKITLKSSFGIILGIMSLVIIKFF